MQRGGTLFSLPDDGSGSRSERYAGAEFKRRQPRRHGALEFDFDVWLDGPGVLAVDVEL